MPFNIQLDRRKKTKPQVMILCDISDSVLNASRFMLQFVYSVQDLYAKVRSFVFVSDLGEVTKLFEEHEISEPSKRRSKAMSSTFSRTPILAALLNCFIKTIFPR